MTQAERDRLVVLRKARKKLITHRQEAEDLDVSVRQVKRLLQEWKKRGDRAVCTGCGESARRARSPVEAWRTRYLIA